MNEKLAAVGLDEKEQRFYLAALELGGAPVTLVATRAGVTRTNGYDLLTRLERRGLLTQVHGDDGVRQVVPADPNVLIREWEQTRIMLDELVPELRSMFNSTPRKPRIRFYEGEKGIQHALWTTLECQSKHLYGILSMHELLEVPGAAWMDGYIAERIKRGIHLDVVRSYSRETEPIWDTDRSALRELRFAPSELDLGMTVYICDDTVVYISSKNENYALTIESRELASLQKSLFQSLWRLSKKHK
ncbi:transcriptional regulator TrmB [Noviherbaspirillum cavernae]|uniref:Transcriptional regulator TrmB n=1 Tax=Noviherbaspirillum cavernae TaxID=2320862 RepID=A0A418WW26_9BURK|nr:helix-turn-helix domain-containing protein [Noviherbaspirillum cavernae]RJF96809.1 transcriptional regulator TrmB [Noviherbaspirillum cavernae]